MRYLCLVLVVGCSDNKISKTMGIGPGGGEVSAGGALVNIPAGALTSNTMISVSSSSAAAPTDTVAVGTPYVFGPEGTQFGQPVTITLAFSSSLLPSGSSSADIIMYTAPAGSTNYDALPTTLSDASHITAQTTHFSVFLPAVKQHGNPHDMSTGSSGDMSAVVVPDGGSSDGGGGGGDMIETPDQATGDAASCTPAFASPANGGCIVNDSCNGHTYTVACQVNACSCLVDNVQTSFINASNACAMTAQQLYSLCFPTA
jgi:hypothetical protein